MVKTLQSNRWLQFTARVFIRLLRRNAEHGECYIWFVGGSPVSGLRWFPESSPKTSSRWFSARATQANSRDMRPKTPRKP